MDLEGLKVKKFKYVAASILVALCCVIVIGVPKLALAEAAVQNQLTVNVTDDYYGQPVDGVTITVTNTVTGTNAVTMITNQNGRAQTTLANGSYKVEQTKFKAGYVIDHTAKNVTFSAPAGSDGDPQTINFENVHIMGQLYVGAEDIQTSSTINDVQFDIEDEFGNRIASNVPGGQSVTVPVTGSYTVIPKNYPPELAYNSDAVMIDSVFACTPGSINGMVRLHAVTFPYDSDTYLFEETTRATVKLPIRRGNIIVRVVDQYGNPIVGATLKATPPYAPPAGIPSPACPPSMGGLNTPDPAYLTGTSVPRVMTQEAPNPGVPYTQTGHVDRDADKNYLLTTGPDGTVVIPDYLVERESTITQLTTLDGYTIDAPNPQVGEITGSNETTTVTFVNRRPEPPIPEPQPQPETPKAKKVKKSALPDTGDNALTLPLIIGVAGVTIVVVGAVLFLHKKRQ